MEENCIPGVIRREGAWLIPSNANKPKRPEEPEFKGEKLHPHLLTFGTVDERKKWGTPGQFRTASSYRKERFAIPANRLHGGLIMKNEWNYIPVGDYYIPNLKILEEDRCIGKWGRMHRDYLKEHHPVQYNALILPGKFWTYLADLNQQTQDRLEVIVNTPQLHSL